jgi:hypothetical protein
MDENIVALIQTISGILQTIAVLVTLIILIKQYKKFTQQTKVSNYTKQIELLKELRLLRISSPELSKSYTTELNDTTENYTKEHFFNLIVLSVFEITFINYKEETIDKNTWDFWFKSLEVICKEESFRNMMNKEQHKIANPEFLNIVEKIIEKQKLTEIQTEQNVSR